MDLVEPGIGRRDSNQRGIAVLVADAPDRLVARVDDDIADPRILEQHAPGAAIDIDLHQVAKGVIVVGVIGFARIGVERQAGHLVEHHPLQLGELAQATGGEVHRAKKADLTGKTERGDQRIGLFIDIAARHRPQSLGAEMGHLGQGVDGQPGEVGALEQALVGEPTSPGPVERGAEYVTELGGVETGAALVSAEPFDQPIGPIGQRQPAVESRAIEIVVDPDLEIDRCAFALQPERRIEAVAIADLGAEHHFVIAALRAPQPARHPRFEKHRRAFEIPARDIVSRGSEVIVENRLGVFLDRHRLAVEKFPPARVLPVPHVHRRDVRQFMVDQREEALARGEGFHRDAERGDVEQHRIIGRRARRGIAVIAEILEQHRRPVPRLPVEPLLVRRQRIFDTARDIRCEIGLDRVEIEQ